MSHDADQPIELAPRIVEALKKYLADQDVRFSDHAATRLANDVVREFLEKRGYLQPEAALCSTPRNEVPPPPPPRTSAQEEGEKPEAPAL